MEREFSWKNMREINRLIVEVAKGNFAYKIPRSNFKDLIEALSQRLNMMTEDLRENLKHIYYVNPHKNYQLLYNMSLILNDSHLITGCSENAFALFKRNRKDLIGRDFESIISKDSMPVWEEIRQVIKNNFSSNSTYRLEYVTGERLLIPVNCFVLRLVNENGPTRTYMITFFTTVVQKTDSKESGENGSSKKRMTTWDIKSIQNIHDYITQHFTNPRLSNKELASMFNINEYRLSSGFKELFGTTPFKYFSELRLQESKVLIRNTNKSLEEISFMLGFESYPHFSKAFKRRFGYSPILLKKDRHHDGEDK